MNLTPITKTAVPTRVMEAWAQRITAEMNLAKTSATQTFEHQSAQKTALNAINKFDEVAKAENFSTTDPSNIDQLLAIQNKIENARKKLDVIA